MNFIYKSLSVILIISLFLPAIAIAKEKEEKVYVRTEEAHPFWVIGKSTLWGGLTGLMLGGAVDILSDNDESIAGKGFAIGVIIGFGVGLYSEVNRNKKEDEESKNISINVLPQINVKKTDNKKVLVYKWDLIRYNF